MNKWRGSRKEEELVSPLGFKEKGRLCKVSPSYHGVSHLWTLSESLNRETHFPCFPCCHIFNVFFPLQLPSKMLPLHLYPLSSLPDVELEVITVTTATPDPMDFSCSQRRTHTHSKRQIRYVYTPVSSLGHRENHLNIRHTFSLKCSSFLFLWAASVVLSRVTERGQMLGTKLNFTRRHQNQERTWGKKGTQKYKGAHVKPFYHKPHLQSL